MDSWSSRRKLLIGGGVLSIILFVAVAIFFLVFYKAPTCFDRIQNGGEAGVDCGGRCVKLCQSAYLPAKIGWGGGKFEMVDEGFYNVAAYVINPNRNGAAVKVPYKFSLFDNRGILIVEREGYIDLPAARNTLVFEPAVEVGKRVPTKATFEFTAPPVWFKSYDTLQGISIVDKRYNEDQKSSSLEVELENKSLLPYRDITVGAVLYDKDGNTIGFSRTQIDVIQPEGSGMRNSEVAPFTWPFSRDGRVVSVEALPVVYPVRQN